ncbi:MAG: hypothetical protein AAGE88_18205 [Actinomycetota bacterium]
MGDKPGKVTVEWPATGRKLEIAGADLASFTEQGWRLWSPDSGAVAEPEPASTGDGDQDSGPPPAKRRRSAKAGG